VSTTPPWFREAEWTSTVVSLDATTSSISLPDLSYVLLRSTFGVESVFGVGGGILWTPGREWRQQRFGLLLDLLWYLRLQQWDDSQSNTLFKIVLIFVRAIPVAHG
jgi:hypothetical protein